jgi:hypothetical protein
MTSRDRYVRILATTATILLALTIGSAAEAHGHPPPHNDRDHRGQVATPPAAKGTYNPATATVRDHRTPAGNGASAIPAGTPRK